MPFKMVSIHWCDMTFIRISLFPIRIPFKSATILLDFLRNQLHVCTLFTFFYNYFVPTIKYNVYLYKRRMTNNLTFPSLYFFVTTYILRYVTYILTYVLRNNLSYLIKKSGMYSNHQEKFSESIFFLQAINRMGSQQLVLKVRIFKLNLSWIPSRSKAA